MPPPVKPLIWFQKVPRWVHWFVEEQFWRDVATRTIAGAIVVGLSYLFGVGAGTIPPPTNKNIGFDVVVVLAALLLSLFLAFGFAGGLDLSHSGPPGKNLVVPGSSDPVGYKFWLDKPWWRKALYYAIRVAILTMPLWGTVGLSWLVLSLA